MSTQLTPANIARLVEHACAIEVSAEKEGCVTFTRSIDGRSGQDFLVAAMNTAPYYEKLARRVAADPRMPIFSYFPQALSHANENKSEKTVNFGILEVMFQAVYARLLTSDPEKVVDIMIALTKREQPLDVQYLLTAREMAWKSSRKEEKRDFNSAPFAHLNSVRAFYGALVDNFPANSSNHQWGAEFLNGLPAIRAYLSGLDKNPKYRESIEKTYRELHRDRPETKVGILADMAAAALFLRLSFN